MKKIGNKEILIHVIGVVGFMSFPILFSPDIFSTRELIGIQGFRNDFIFHFLLCVYFYFSYYFLIDHFYFKGKYLLYFSISISLFLLALILSSYLGSHMFFHHNEVEPIGGIMQHRRHHGQHGMRFLGFEFSKHLLQFLMLSVLGIFIKTNQRHKSLEKSKRELELSYLKSKLNPHFLFNTLNGIYALSLEKSDKTAPAIVKLSGMMRYLLSDAEKEKVSLKNELNYINDYIELQRLRLTEDNHLLYCVEGNPNAHSIAPMVLMAFIENAFKYGVNPELKSNIEIYIVLNEDEIFLDVYNVKSISKNIDDESNGRGLSSTIEILEKSYAGKYELEIEDQNDYYRVKLKIKFND